MTASIFQLNFDNSFARLPSEFYTKMNAESFLSQPFTLHINPSAAQLINLSTRAFEDPDFPFYFSGSKNLPGAEPLAMVYSGHQFGVWAGQLGDGRALLLGQVRNQNKQLWDVQLKGSGLTPYSRMGDGRAVLRSCIREYLASEAMHCLGIPTTRALALVGTGELVAREVLEPGAILVRLSPSHIRFGHFEHFFHSQRGDLVKQLADYVIGEHFPGYSYVEWLLEVIQKTAQLVAHWQALGFAHGVMNTDNMSVLGLTLDYGPFGFMEGFDPGYICNHSDTYGRYAFDQQPAVALWNLHAFAYALQPLLPFKEAQEILSTFDGEFRAHYRMLMTKKLGLETYRHGDEKLWQSLLNLMAQDQADYTLTFRALSYLDSEQDTRTLTNLFKHSEKLKAWLILYFERIKHIPRKQRQAQMLAINPKYILRNWIAETVIRQAEDEENYTLLDTVLKIMQSPFEDHPGFEHFAAFAPEHLQNLCISCSS